jgi:hypothetical protein
MTVAAFTPPMIFNLGLMKAAERFDETLGFKFISFAVNVWFKLKNHSLPL